LLLRRWLTSSSEQFKEELGEKQRELDEAKEGITVLKAELQKIKSTIETKEVCIRLHPS